METEVDEHQGGGLAEPGPRLARTLAEQAAADDARRARFRLVIGGVFLLIGLGVAALALWSVLRDDGPAERKVGKLTSANLTGTTAADGAGTSGTKTTTKTTSKGGTTPTTAAVDPTSTKTDWPAAVHGRPKAFGIDGDPPPATAKGLSDGFYLWLDFKGWHLWMVGGEGSDASVEIVADNAIAKADPASGSPDITVGGNRLTLARGGEGAAVTGVDFSVGFYGRTMVITTTGDLPLHTGRRAAAAADLLGIQRNRENA